MVSTAAVLGSVIASESNASHDMIRDVGEGKKEFKEVIEATRRIALTNPLGRNADLAYFNEDMTPCCIFGHALHSLGIPADEVPNSYSMSDLPWDVWGFNNPNYYQSLWAARVQTNADLGDAWILALAAADATPI